MLYHERPSQKSLGAAGLSVLLYDRGLHPELFAVDLRRTRVLAGMEVVMWLLNGGGHLVAVTGLAGQNRDGSGLFPQ